jgi:hypothetical protein
VFIVIVVVVIIIIIIIIVVRRVNCVWIPDTSARTGDDRF